MKNFLGIITFLSISFSVSAQSTLCPSAPTMFCCEYVESVSINGVNFSGDTSNVFGAGVNGGRSTGSNPPNIPGYFDYTGTVMPISAGTTIPFSCVVKTNSTYQEYVKLWIDFNNNGNLGDPGELVYDQNYTFNDTKTYAANIAIPSTAFNGPVRMRLIMVFNANPVLCGSYDYGNTFDFGSSVTNGVNPIKLTVAKTGLGSIVSSPAGIATASGFTSSDFAESSVVSLTATPTAPQLFTGWTGADGFTSNSSTINVTMDVAKTLTANFAQTVPPTISNFNNLNKLLFDDSFVIGAPTSNSLGAFIYSSSNPSVASISGTTVTINSAGTTTITANQEATATYTSGAVNASLTVNSVDVITKKGKGSSLLDKLDYMDANGKKGGNRGLTRFGEIKITKSN